jgi:hypothetical protein
MIQQAFGALSILAGLGLLAAYVGNWAYRRGYKQGFLRGRVAENVWWAEVEGAAERERIKMGKAE